MTTEAIILARVKTNPTFRTEDNTADVGAALRVDPLASLCADSESVMGKKLLSESVGPSGQQPAHADPTHLGASAPPPYGCCKTPSAEPQKIPLLPSAGGVVTADGKPPDWGLNSIASFLKISPYTAATMYPFLDMAYKAALMAPPSPFLYQHLAYPSWCQMSESGSPEDRLFYLPHYVPAHLSSHLEPDLRMYASSPAAVSPRRSLRGRQQASAFGTSPRQDTRCSAFHFNERHLSKSSANSSLSTSTNTGSTGNGSSARDPLNEFVPASASMSLPVSTTADSREISKRSTASSAQCCGFSPFRVDSSRGSEPDPPKPTGGSRQKSASPDRRTTEKSPSPARTSVDGKVHRLPLDLSAKKMKSSSNGFQSKSDFIAQLSYGPQTGDARCLFPPPTRSAKSSEPPKVMKSLNLDQGAVGSPSSQRSPESFSSRQLGRQAPHMTDSQDARTFLGKQMSPKVRGQDNRPNLSEPRQPNVELGSTSGTIRADSFGLGFSNGSLLPYLTADDASLQRMSVSGKGDGHRYPVLLGHSSGLTRTPTKQDLPHREDSPAPLSPAATFTDLKQTSETRHGGQNLRPSQTRKADPERSGRGSQLASNKPFKSFCNPFNSVRESVVGVDMPFEDLDETEGRRGVRAPTSQPHPLRHRCSSPAPAPSKEISMEASLSPPPELPVQQTMHCARTSPEQFSKKKQTGAPFGCDGSARCERGADGLDKSDDEDQLDRSPSSRTDASQESSYARCSTAQFLKGAAVGCTSQSDGPIFTRKTTTCGDTPLQMPADVVNTDKESCLSIIQREQNSADDGRSVDLRHPAYGCAVGDRLGQAPLPGNNSKAIFRDGEKNSLDIMDVQVAEAKDTRISTPTESFSGSLDSRAKYETEESRASQSSCPRQEQSKLKENQDDETVTSREAEPADGPPCDAGGGEGGWFELCQQSEGRGGGPAPALCVDAQKDAQPSSICVTPKHHRDNDLVGKDGCSPEKEESHREERQEAPPVTGVAGFHCNKPSSMMGLSDLDPDMATNHKRVLGLGPFHQRSVSGRWVKRRRTQDSGAENPFDDDLTPEDMSKQKSCNELNGPCIKKPRLPDDDVKVHMASSPPGLPRAPRQMGSSNLWQSSHVAASCLQEKCRKLKENRRVSSLLALSSDDDLEKPTGKHLCKTKHTSEAAEEADEERGDGEGGIVRVSSDSCSPPPQPSFAVEPAGDETPLQHAARSGCEEAVLDCLQRRLRNINHRDDAAYCALHEACTRGWLTIVRHLVEHGADVNCSAQDGTRPLHDAVENNHVEVVRFLLACGADPTLTSCSGRGPIDMTSSVAMETFLEEYLADLQGRPEGDSGICWDFYGSSVCEPSTEGGVFNILAHPPGPEEEEEDEEEETERRLGREEFEIEQPLLPCYTLQVSPATGPRNWLLLCDVLAHLQMTAHTFRRLFPHLEVFTIPEADFYRQTSLSLPCAHPAQRASFRTGAKDRLHLVEATPEMSVLLGSSIEFVNNWEPPVVSNISPRPAPPPPSSSPGVPVLPSHASGGGASQGQSQDFAPVTTVERKANASSCVTRNQETINMLEAKNNSGPSSKTDSVACEVQHLQNGVTVSTHCGSEEHSQCGEITDAHTSNRNSQNEDSEGVPQVVGEAFEKVGTRAIDQKCRSLRDLSGQTVKMDAAWRRHLANVRVHIRDLGMKFAGGRTLSNEMDSRKVVDKVTESKATQLKNQLG